MEISKENHTYLDIKVVDITTPTTFLEFRCPEFPNYNINNLHQDLTSIIIQTGDVQKRTSNVKALMTHWTMTGHEPFKILSDHVENIIKYFYNSVSTLNLEIFTSACWGAIYEKGDYTNIHSHSPSLLSWVYYVKATKKSSPIIFRDGYSYQPKPGYGIIFPSFAYHEVPPEKYGQRIVVSGNIELDYFRTTEK